MLDRLKASAEWRLFAMFLRAAPGLTVAWWALTLLRGVLPAVFVVAMGLTVGAVRDGNAITGPMTLLGVAFVLVQALGPVHDAVASNLGATLTNWLQERLLDACARPPGLAHLERPDLADQLSASRDFDLGLAGPDIVTAMPFVSAGLSSLIAGGVQALVLFAYRWWAPLVIGGAWLSTHHFLKVGAIWHARHDDDVIEQQRRAEYGYRLLVDAPAAKEVRLFGITDWVVDAFKSLRRGLFDRSWEARRLGWRHTKWAMAVVVGAHALFFWALARDAAAGEVSAAALVVFAQAAIGTSTLAFGEFDWWFRTAAQPIPLVLDLAARMAPVGMLPSKGRAVGPAVPAREIRLTGVKFAYPTSDRLVFDGLDLTIPAGRSLAIVGQNGAGKTTLAKLLCRMYDPADGVVTVDGSDLRELDLAAWRGRVAAVFQDFVRYELPLRDNVAPGGAPDVEIERALDLASASQLAGLDTVLSRAYDGGTDLSGGQWQRVALARALCAVGLGAGLVILDEPTAQLDVRGEAEIFERLLEATRGSTTVLISHRFSTVRRADQICVLEEGKVVELGTHDELMARGGRYRTMFDLQAARFDDAGADDGEPLEVQH